MVLVKELMDGLARIGGVNEFDGLIALGIRRSLNTYGPDIAVQPAARPTPLRRRFLFLYQLGIINRWPTWILSGDCRVSWFASMMRLYALGIP